MFSKEFFHQIIQDPRNEENIDLLPRGRKVDLRKITFQFLEEGYAYECYMKNNEEGRVSWFWQPGEFIIPTSEYSRVVMQSDCKTQQLSHINVIQTLRKFPESRYHYKEIRDAHNKKVAVRVKELKTLSAVEQYIRLLKDKPWVFEHFGESQIASYLGISLVEYQSYQSQMNSRN
jgi:hypothetical protein